MNVSTPQAPHGKLVFVTEQTRLELSRLAKAGKAKKLARGIYVIGATLPLQDVIRQHLHEIVAVTWPGGVLCGKSALSGGMAKGGELFVAQPKLKRKKELKLDGVTIYPVIGPEVLPGDVALPMGIAISGDARSLVENIDLLGRAPRHRAGSVAVGDKIDSLASYSDLSRVEKTLGELEVIAPHFDQRAVEVVRSNLRRVLGSAKDPGKILSLRLRARVGGNPYDAHRIRIIENLVKTLDRNAPRPRPTLDPQTQWEWLAFFESYFSNFIEGTEFSVAEARDIVIGGEKNHTRPADAHDVTATYQLASDPVDRIKVPTSGEGLIQILCDRHATLMAARQDKNPGVLKTIRNQAGGMLFVDPGLVEGTLIHGFEVLNSLTDPFGRAIATMALVTECHPFDDGNGRVARLTANAELSAAGQVRIIIPTVYRNNYIVALNGFSGEAGQGESLIAVLDFAQKWTSSVDWSTFEGALLILEKCNAFKDPGTVEHAINGLRIPVN